MLITSLLSLLLSNAVSLRRDKAILYSRTSISILLLVFIINLSNSHINVISTGIGLYGGLLHIDSLSQSIQSFIFIVSSIILFLTSFFPRKIIQIKSSLNTTVGNKFKLKEENILNRKSEHLKIIEYPLILIFIITGAVFLINSNDMISIFISIELQSYGLYLLATLYRNSETSTSAGLTYFLLGGMSSCFILLGTALLYTNSGVTNLENLYIINNIWDISMYNVTSVFQNNYIVYALIIMVVGFLFKISAAPFHFWSPDVYDAIPTIVTTFVAIIAKLSVLTFLFEIVHYTTSTVYSDTFDWRYVLLISSLLSLIVGTVLGLNQSRIKRLYAYSTISHLGFILLALSINTVESLQAFVFYLTQYSLSNLNAFVILISIGFTLYMYKTNNNEENKLLIDKDNSPVQLISQLKGYFYINPLIAISLAITIYSFVGVPPLLGFFAKQMVLSAALDNGFVFLTLVAILTSVISAVYYLNIIKNIFFEKPDYYLNEKYNDIHKNYQIVLSGAFSITISVITLLILTFLLLQQDILNTTNLVSIYIYNI